jgi:hypothetical protein
VRRNERKLAGRDAGGQFWAKTQAMVSYLVGRFGMSDRDVVELMEVGSRTEMSLGSVPAQEQRSVEL